MSTQKEQWHLSRSISIGHIITTAGVIITAVFYLGNIEEKVAINTSNINHNTVSISEAKETNQDVFIRLDNNIKDMSSKIDDLYKLLLTWQKK